LEIDENDDDLIIKGTSFKNEPPFEGKYQKENTIVMDCRRQNRRS